MADTAFEPDESAIPLRRSTGARGLRTGPLRILGPRRASSLPLAMIAMLAAAGSAAAFITVQPPTQIVDDVPLVELASLPPAAEEPLRAEQPAETMPVEPAAAAEASQSQEPAPPSISAPMPQPQPTEAANSSFGLHNLPVLEADETSLGIDDALDALSAPITPQAKPAARRTTTAVFGRHTRNATPIN